MAVFVPSGWAPAMPWWEGSGVVMVPDELVGRWEAVYREYGVTSEAVNSSVPGDRAVARRMARASEDVAVVWREMSDGSGLPWWAVAALVAAGQAFEHQARDWAARARVDGSRSGGRRSGYREPRAIGLVSDISAGGVPGVE